MTTIGTMTGTMGASVLVPCMFMLAQLPGQQAPPPAVEVRL